jgi:hypothetical protein
MCLSRRDNYMRGPTHADNNLKPEFCCGMCMTLAQLALHLGAQQPAAAAGRRPPARPDPHAASPRRDVGRSCPQ